MAVGAAVWIALGFGEAPAPRMAANAGSEPGASPAQASLAARVMRSPLPAPISGEVVVADRDRLLIAGGLDAAGNSASGVFSLDPSSGHLTPAGTLAEPLHDAAGAFVDGRLFVVGGGQATSTSHVEALDAAGDGRVTGQLPTPRSDLTALTVGGRMYVVGGYNGNAPSAAILVSSDGRSFSSVARLPVPVRYPAVAASGATIYAFGGETGAGRPTDAIQAVDTRTGRSLLVGRLPAPLAHAAALTLGGGVYVLGGTTGAGPTADILQLDPGRGAVTRAGRLPQPVTNAAAATLGAKGYLVGGLGPDGSPLRSIIALEQRPRPAGASAPQARAGTPGTPFRGRLLIADRGNNRLLVVDARKRVLWRYPGPRPAPKGGFYFPDDAFFIHHGRGIISNEEQNEAIVELAYPSGEADPLVRPSRGHRIGPGVLPRTRRRLSPARWNCDRRRRPELSRPLHGPRPPHVPDRHDGKLRARSAA